MDMFKIECNGEFKSSRGGVLVRCVQEELRGDPDLVIVAQGGDIIPVHRSVLGLYSSTLPAILDTVHCCQNVGVSIPFPAATISSLLRLLAFGASTPVGRKEFANLTECAQLLGISLQGLEFVPQDKITVEVGEGQHSLISLLTNGQGPLAHIPAKIGAPRANQPAAKGVKRKRKEKEVQPTPRISEDEIIEITPEMYAQEGMGDMEDIIHEEEEEDRDDGKLSLIPQHFLMQEHGIESSRDWEEDHAWNQDSQGQPMGHGELMIDLEGGREEEEDGGRAKPEVREVPSLEDPQVKVYECSFCPGQHFKKKNDINRHLKKHVPIEMRKRFQCDSCKEKFINNSNLKVHLKVCTGVIKEYVCKKCGDVQHNKTDHLDHLARMHNINKKHGCPICHKQLKKTSDLKKHMATHSNQKPFGCEVCGKRFKTESYVKVHMKAHFPDGEVPAHLLAAPVLQQQEPVLPSSEPDRAPTSEPEMPTEEEIRIDEPEMLDEEPEMISAEPEMIIDEPEMTIDEPEMTIDEPEMVHDEPEVARNEPDAQNGEPEAPKEPEGLYDQVYSNGGHSPVGTDEGTEGTDSQSGAESTSGTDTPSGAITPEFVNTPEGGSTGDELELNQSELQYEKKDIYVQQMNLFRNSTEIL